MILATFHHFIGTWAPLASWAVALGTGLLGLATWRLGTKAQSETNAVSKQVELEQQQLEASQRPFVLPVTTGWRPKGAFMPEPFNVTRPPRAKPEPWMMLSNAGTGPAYNVTGGLFWEGGIGGGWQLVPASVPAGRDIPASLETHAGFDVKWAEAIGYLRYLDLAGTEWQTRFRYRQNTSGQFSVEVLGYGKASKLGEPDYNS
jgi:hypothetical protein